MHIETVCKAVIVITTMDFEFMKPVQNSDDKEETDSLLLQSNLEYSNSNYASTSVQLRMESEDLFNKRNQGGFTGFLCSIG